MTGHPTGRPGSPVTAATWVLRSQLALFGSLALCTAVLPGFLFSRDMGGVSNYGVHAETVVPYTLGTLAGAWALRQAAALARAPRTFPLVARGAAAALLVNLVTTYPYKSSPTWATVHTWTAIALAVVEFVGGLTVLHPPRPDAARLSAAVLLLVGFTGLVLTYVGLLHVLFVAESTTAAGFGLALYTAARGTPALTPGTRPAGRSRHG